VLAWCDISLLLSGSQNKLMFNGRREKGKVSPKWFQQAFASSAPADDIPIGTPSSFPYHLAKRFVIRIIVASLLVGSCKKEKTWVASHKLLYKCRGISTQDRLLRYLASHFTFGPTSVQRVHPSTTIFHFSVQVFRV
jgi:hypothetical protein